jgi:hypothetical protein
MEKRHMFAQNGLQVGQNIGDAVPEVGNAMKISIPL